MTAAALRLPFQGMLWLLAAAVLWGADKPTALASARSPANVRFANVDYVDAARFGARFGLAFQADGASAKFSLQGGGTRIALEVDSRESVFNGRRVFLGEPVRGRQGQRYISRIDAERLLTPLLVPGKGEKSVPRLRIIALDPGHGGRDAGKSNGPLQLQEKTLALDTARRLERLLEAQGYRVVMTRRGDKYVELAERAEIARRAGADLFISLHYNSVESSASRVTGVEVFTMTPQFQYSTSDTAREDVALARVAGPGNAYDHWNVVVGHYLHRGLVRDLGVPDRGFKRARYAVLRLAGCPAVLVEAGYLSHDAEARRISSPAYRQKIATSIADGVRSYADTLKELRAAASASRRARPVPPAS